jgi:hypothetical protein
MLDTSAPTSVGQALSGQQQAPQQDPQQVGNTPLSARMAQFQGQQQQPQQQAPPQPSPQQVATAQKHQQLGKVASFLFGHQTDEAGNAVKQPPGQLFRSLLAGALLGMAAGSSAPAGGGKLGGALSGLGHGFAGVEQQNYQRQQQAKDEQRKQQAESREEQGFKTEQTMREATIAHENLETVRTQQLINRGTLDQYKEQAELGTAKLEPYVVSGIPAVATDKTADEHTAIVKANPKAVAWDWEQTGVKTVLTKDKDGNQVSHYVPTFSAYDPNSNVTITPGFIKLLKDAHIDDTYPGTTDRLREGQQLKPIEFSALKGQYQKAYNDNLARQKAGLETEETKAKIKDYNSQALERSRQAARADRTNKQSQLLSDALDDWDQAGPGPEGFAKLSQKSQFAITTNLVKTIDSLERQIKDALQDADQDRADRLKEQQERYRDLQRMAIPARSAAPAGQSAPNLKQTPQKATVYDPQGQPHFVDGDKVNAFLADPKYKGWHQ